MAEALSTTFQRGPGRSKCAEHTANTENQPVQPNPPHVATFMEPMPRAATPKRTPPPKRNRVPSVQEEPPEIPVEGGFLVLRVMEDDNSCM